MSIELAPYLFYSLSLNRLPTSGGPAAAESAATAPAEASESAAAEPSARPAAPGASTAHAGKQKKEQKRPWMFDKEKSNDQEKKQR